MTANASRRHRQSLPNGETPSRVEFGDFQTPTALAGHVCRLLANRGLRPGAIVEPTCGTGTFVLAALDRFPEATFHAADINPDYVDRLAADLAARGDRERCRLVCDSFFRLDWNALFEVLPQPMLVLGNPPWVTNSRLSGLGSANLPEKSNVQRYSGLEALTGKSNFDISEWMLTRLLDALAGKPAWLAMLCKTAVARKALVHAWKTGIAIDEAEIRTIDAQAAFGAAVDACLLICSISPHGRTTECRVFSGLDATQPTNVIGWREGQLVAEVAAFDRWKHLAGAGPPQWRSGVKHDCTRVMEFRKEPAGYRNGLGELVELEDDYLYPMLKSSELARGRIDQPVRWMLVPQNAIGQETSGIRQRAPKTWAYLQRHGEALDRRRSSIYRNRPRFSVFGVGNYTFAPWKVAISGFYKRLAFRAVGDVRGKPVVFDDTVSFLPCASEAEARLAADLLNSPAANEFYSTFLFWDMKRPVTIELLRKLDLGSLARELGADAARLPAGNGGQPTSPLRR